MKKAIYIFAMISLFSLAISPALAITTTGSVSTGLTRDTSGGAIPVVHAKWEANYISAANRYTDASTDAGAQFTASGVYNGNKTISMCAIVSDPDGLADIKNVYADVFYPVNVALGSSHVKLADQSGLGCGQLMQEDSLTKLSKDAGILLFCDKVRTLNTNLPSFLNGVENYDGICSVTGLLQKDLAAVYCGQKTISYEDPAGEYKVWAVGQDQVGNQGTLENHFDYLPTTAFEADFNQINYENVRLNTHKIIAGDLTWATTPGTNGASVRNTGNTRLSMQVSQNDMGLGMTDGLYNVKYDARVGSDSPYANYIPGQTVELEDELDLSELDEMDFSILISKFPPSNPGPSYTGTITLSAVAEDHLVCPTN